MSTVIENSILKSVQNRKGWWRGRFTLSGPSALVEICLGSACLSDKVVKSIDRIGQEAARSVEGHTALPSSSWLPLLPVVFHFVNSQILIYFSLLEFHLWLLIELCVPAARARILFSPGYFHCGGVRTHLFVSRYPILPPQHVDLGRTHAWGSQSPGQIM